MQDLASEFSKILRGWYPRTLTAGGGSERGRPPPAPNTQLGLWPGAGRKRPGVGAQSLVPLNFSAVVAPLVTVQEQSSPNFTNRQAPVRARTDEVIKVMGSNVKVAQWQPWKSCEFDSWRTIECIWTKADINTHCTNLGDTLIRFSRSCSQRSRSCSYARENIMKAKISDGLIAVDNRNSFLVFECIT